MKKFVLFDFDGVISDSFGLAYAISKSKCPHLTEEEYRKRFEGNINDYKENVDAHGPDCRLDMDFFSEYVPRMKSEVRLVPKMGETVTALAQEYTLIVVSSTISSPIQEFLISHNLSQHFSWIMGNDVHKSKVEKIKMVFEKYNIIATDCVFITDTLGDMHEASKMSIVSIGVTWGFHSHETLERGMPFRLVETPEELSHAISDVFTKVRT